MYLTNRIWGLYPEPSYSLQGIFGIMRSHPPRKTGKYMVYLGLLCEIHIRRLVRSSWNPSAWAWLRMQNVNLATLGENLILARVGILRVITSLPRTILTCTMANVGGVSQCQPQCRAAWSTNNPDVQSGRGVPAASPKNPAANKS
jgi:hypothetical protein